MRIRRASWRSGGLNFSCWLLVPGCWLLVESKMQRSGSIGPERTTRQCQGCPTTRVRRPIFHPTSQKPNTEIGRSAKNRKPKPQRAGPSKSGFDWANCTSPGRGNKSGVQYWSEPTRPQQSSHHAHCPSDERVTRDPGGELASR